MAATYKAAYPACGPAAWRPTTRRKYRGGAAAPSYDLVILAGQSNMVGVDQALGVGNTYSPDPVLDATSPRIFQWSPDGTGVPASANVLLEAVDPLLFPEDLVSAERTAEYAVSPGMAFARNLLPSLPSSRNVVLIPCAVRGTGFAGTDNWLPPSGTLYVQMIATVEAALAALPNSRVTHVLWCQGETDAETGGASVSGYEANLLALIAAIRTDLSLPTLPFISMGMVPEYRDSWGGINAKRADYQTVDLVHKAYPLAVDYAYHLPAPFTYATSGNEIHFTKPGTRLMGANGEAVEHLVAGLTAAAPSPITDLSAYNPRRLRFTVPASGLHGVVTRKRAAGSADSWTEETPDLDYPLTPGATVDFTILGTATALECQVKAVSRGGSSAWSDTLVLPTDSDFASVTYLFAFNGQDGTTTGITNFGSVGGTVTCAGDAKLYRAAAKFPPYGAALRLDGVGDYAHMADNAGAEFGSGDFTLECHVRWAGTPTNSAAGQGIVSKYVGTGNQREWALLWGQNSESNLKFFISTAGTVGVERLTFAWTPTAGQWHHLAVTKASGVYRLHIDGVQVATATQVETLFAGTAPLEIGRYGTNYMGVSGGPARIADLRITKGVARYGASTFTVPGQLPVCGP